MSAVDHAPEWVLRWQSIVASVSIIESDSDEYAFVDKMLAGGNTRILAFVNAHAMNSMVGNESFFFCLKDADVLLRDGSGMKVLYQASGLPAGKNMNGTDFIPQVLSRCSGRRIALWGTAEPYLSEAASTIVQRYGCEVVSMLNGFLDETAYLTEFNQHLPDVIVLGMGMPKQERVAKLLRSEHEHGPLIICGGAILDFLGGKVRRAPMWMQNLGIEWLFRLCIEPKRLFKRYVVGNPAFLARSLIFKRYLR